MYESDQIYQTKFSHKMLWVVVIKDWKIPSLVHAYTERIIQVHCS